MVITTEQFDALLDWLDPDRETAGRKYEAIRAGLVRVFVSKGLNNAEDLADDVINRVTARLPDFRDTYSGEPARYFHGVARNVLKEVTRQKELTIEVTSVTVFVDPIISNELECLDTCLQVLQSEKSDFILDYYLYEGHDKVEHHKQMAVALGISHGALRGRAFQIRVGLEECVKQCVARKEKQNMSQNH